MFSQVFYLIRSKVDGQYLIAHPLLSEEREGRPREDQSTLEPAYLILFKEHFDALSYLNTHGAHVSDQFAVESISGDQIGGILQRWGFTGIGLVEDPLLPRIEFMQHTADR